MQRQDMERVSDRIGRGAGAVQRLGPTGCVKTPPFEVGTSAEITEA